MHTLFSWLGRLSRFVSQMFPVFPAQIATLGSFVLSYLILSRFLAPKKMVPIELFCGGLSIVLFNLLLRVFDELKDYESDKRNFPDRPLVKGVVSHSDLYLGITVITCLLLGLQIPFLLRPVFPTFLVTLVFSFLTYKWFFFERAIRASLPLALVTHHPIVFFFQLYTLSFFASPLGAPSAAIVFVFGLALGGTCWEISRKMRGRQEEGSYTTYTKIWGPAASSGLLAALVVASFLMTLLPLLGVSHVRAWLVLGAWIAPLAAAANLFWLLIRFNRDPRKAPPLRKAVELYDLALLVAVLVAVVGG